MNTFKKTVSNEIYDFCRYRIDDHETSITHV